MPTIEPNSPVLDPETLSIMGDAYQSALRSFPTSAPQDVRHAIAASILEQVRNGERDPARLCQMAIQSLPGPWIKGDPAETIHQGGSVF
jgi:hypothetical protein